ncbi:hypothetical protein QBC36DRAFT_350290 [Triangularia setosa]|uniref:Uncharacterized protein n=1 Tax=Triangularia setosa TaxID=2587417 RepID=A0AAN6VZP9_9PEZI|nr:hypothetical protein QBC36DRAFT_350290 [Podospora setosa]
MRTRFTLALLASRAACQNGNNGVWFIYPTEGHTYQHMDTVNVTYESPFPTPTLFGWCDGGSRNFYDQRAPGYNGSVAVVLNFTSGTPCWFNLRPGRVAGFGANSPAFNLLGVERSSGGIVHAPDTSGSEPAASPSLSSSTTPSSSSTTLGGVAPTGSQVHEEGTVGSSEQAPRPSSQLEQESGEKFRGDGGGLGGGQSAGIVIGAIVGVLIIAAGLFFWWRKRSRKTGQQDYAGQDNHYSHQCQYHSGQSQCQHQAGAGSSWGGSHATHVHGYEHNSANTCVCPAHGQAQVKGWPVELSSKNSPSEISTSDPAWAGRLKFEMPA